MVDTSGIYWRQCVKVRLKHGLLWVSGILKHGCAHALMFQEPTKGHALTYLEYVTIVTRYSLFPSLQMN